MEQIFSQKINPNLDMAELDSMLAEFRNDYNQRHFVRNETFKVGCGAARNACGRGTACPGNGLARRSQFFPAPNCRGGRRPSSCRHHHSCAHPSLPTARLGYLPHPDHQAAAESITGPTRKIFIEFLERSCTAEFSGFLLYKELGRRLKDANPCVAEIFMLLSRDEARHAGFLNKALSDFNLALDLGFLTKNRCGRRRGQGGQASCGASVGASCRAGCGRRQ
jgi:hypothetical protein